MAEAAADWIANGARHIWRPYCQMKTAALPLPVARTEGVKLILADGRELIDGIGAWWTACHGYNHPHIIAAIQKQAALMPHVMLGGLVHEQAARLATRLAALLPGDLDHVFYSDSGSVAVEVAMKMACQYWLNQNIRGRTKFIAFKGGYHGDTVATMAVCDPAIGMHNRFDGLLPQQYILDLPRDEESMAALDAFLASHADEIAGILVEPMVQGAGGMLFQHEDVPKRLRTLADKYNTLLIFDEIFTGFGRLGALFASQICDTVPDIITLGKGLTGGALPLAVTVANKRVFDGFWSDDPACALMHGPTFMGNALGCAAANASLDLFETEPRLFQAHEIAQKLGPRLGVLSGRPGIAAVRVRGALGVVEMERAESLTGLGPRFVAEGVFLRPFGRTLYVVPSLTIDDAALFRLTDAIVKIVG